MRKGNRGPSPVSFSHNRACLRAPARASCATSNPYSISWDTTSASSGSHTLAAVARDAAGNQITSAQRTVTVNNADTSAPAITNVSVSNITQTAATLTWTTNEPADSQVEYGPPVR